MTVGDCGVGGKPHERMILSKVTVFFLVSFLKSMPPTPPNYSGYKVFHKNILSIRRYIL